MITPIQTYKKILDTGVRVFETHQLANLLGVPLKKASELLSHLTLAGLISKVRRGVWVLGQHHDLFSIAGFVTSPYPAYISLQSALLYHQMISQIPSVVYLVSLARSQRYTTPMGIFSSHHIKEELFTGFDVLDHQKGYSFFMATPEKALFDFFYFKPAKSKWFHALPELEFSKKFSWKKFYMFLKYVDHPGRAKMIHTLAETFRKRKNF